MAFRMNPIDISDIIRSSYADDFQFSQSSVGQVPIPIKGLPGRHGYHPTANTMTLIGRIGKIEIQWCLTGETFDAYNRFIGAALTETERNELTYKFLSNRQVPYRITGWPNKS